MVGDKKMTARVKCEEYGGIVIFQDEVYIKFDKNYNVPPYGCSTGTTGNHITAFEKIILNLKQND